ncbi:hypothetical protein HBI81_205210 [Parastagonospora nodorum]|nr:hypothetical protein HBH51_185230 [Parastagonospora nodorum]KAH3963304.1 hypothetical protein HBH52_220550 [Parastagonospora nodorum]KAH3992546.1 hypothetical protein HBI10_216080 [Parastagonospora nodorum]KAH4010401.1 hypothetical protein HBI13_207470 [Parastagonospora nodorum]KAH4043736.1 hypothetical protein HBH49_225650 [Parastagonospora nodorum]
MAGLSSPLRLAPPIAATPRRAPSPTMSPGGRRGRMHGSSEEGRLRDLSPDTTLRAFTQRPVPFDTTCDEYKIFACIDSLTAAERDLGARVAKAAQRLKSWCSEIEQWGWSGSFEQPSDEYREKRRRSLELRIREHVGDADLTNALPPLEYWGSILSVEVESHEARLDDIEEEMLKLDVEELKEHVLDMHPSGRSRPSSAGYEATRQSYKPIDDFSFLITQTLLSALPHHAQLKDRLNTWTARISTLREVPRYLDDLSTAQKAMRLGWDAIDPPADTSDAAFAQWKDAVDTISAVLGNKVSDLGKRLDRMLDNLEGRDDCIPDRWIDTFEAIETDYGRWSHDSRTKVMDFDLRRKYEQQRAPTTHIAVSNEPAPQSTAAVAVQPEFGSVVQDHPTGVVLQPVDKATNSPNGNAAPTTTPAKVTRRIVSDSNVVHREISYTPVNSPGLGSPRVREITTGSSSNRSTPSKKPWFMTDAIASPTNEAGAVRAGSSFINVNGSDELFASGGVEQRMADPISRNDIAQVEEDEESEFDEGDTVVHNDLDDLEDTLEAAIPVQSPHEALQAEHGQVVEPVPEEVPLRRNPTGISENPVIITNDGQDGPMPEPPQTPRSRRGSQGSVSSNISFDDSSPPSYIEDSPSVRNATNRSVRAPRPELNAAMAKRRLGRNIIENSIDSAPWPPTQFSQKSSAEDLERKISDILTTIPAHIRLTSGPSADSPEVKPSRGLANRGSRNYLRAARSVSGLKSPELTLSPAKNEFDSIASGRKSAAASRTDNDIKLYHLTQPGKEQPVKLFIRRVGENGERVMVRVGGGWADLGEYLRQYAEHHGRRTASDGKFEILGLEVKNNDSTNSPSRPESAAGRQDRRISSGRPTASPLTTPTKSSTTGVSIDDAVHPMPSFASTPGIAEEPSVPSTNSSQRSWTGNEAGLAGPKAKKLDLSGEKLEWIEGMMKQARTVSGSVMPVNHTPQQREERADSRSESRSDSRAGGKKPEFGDLGKVGGTKRIFLRGGKPVLE